MKRISHVVCAALVAIVVAAMSVHAQVGGYNVIRDPQNEEKIKTDVARWGEKTAGVFEKANAAADAGDWVGAAQGFEEFNRIIPNFPPAHQRLAVVLVQLNRSHEALSHARVAFRADNSPRNEVTLGYTMYFAAHGIEQAEAMFHVRAAVVVPDDFFAQWALLRVAVELEDHETIGVAAARLMEFEPPYAPAFFYAGQVAGYDKDWGRAEMLLERAAELGVAAEEVDPALAAVRSLAEEEYRSQRLVWLGIGILVGWLGGLAVLLLTGMLLSTLTLQAVYRNQTGAQKPIGSGERRLRWIYRVVIALTSLAFYLSIPMLIASVVIVAGALSYAMVILRIIPGQIIYVVVGLAIFTLVSIVRSLFARHVDTDPGRVLSEEEAPRLWALTKEVAERMDTRPVDSVFLTPGTDIAVMERGGVRQKLSGRGHRSLILGLGMVSHMPLAQFRAILGHEYGHFVNKDTAGGNLATQVQLSIHHMAFRLIANNLNNWFNPAWWFVNGFHRIFLRVTLGASRLQEILADRYAAMAYGVHDFVEGLRFVVRQGLVFPTQMNLALENMARLGHRLDNAYVLPPIEEEDVQKEIDEAIEAAMAHPTTAYDSHPAPDVRISLVDSLGTPPATAADGETIRNLFNDIEALQKEMTEAMIGSNFVAVGPEGEDAVVGWVEADENPFGVRILDCRNVANWMTVSNLDPVQFQKYTELRQSDGEEFRNVEPIDAASVDCDLTYTRSGELEDGPVLKADTLEHKWDIYFLGEEFVFVRSWSGDVIYRARVVVEPGKARIVSVQGPGELVRNHYAVSVVDFLIRSHLLGEMTLHPYPPNLEGMYEYSLAIFSFANYGRLGGLGTFEDTTKIEVREEESPS